MTTTPAPNPHPEFSRAWIEHEDAYSRDMADSDDLLLDRGEVLDALNDQWDTTRAAREQAMTAGDHDQAREHITTMESIATTIDVMAALDPHHRT